jgi:hypothetical protein
MGAIESYQVDMSYVSAFFDGEVAIRVTPAAKSSLLIVTIMICQKSVEVLLAIKKTLSRIGVYSAIYLFASGMYALDIIRIQDVVKFLHSVKSVVKRRQVLAALDYLEGRTTGNEFLLVLEEEHIHHKRKTSPLRILGPKFPLTRPQVLAASAIISSKARVEGNRRAYLKRLEKRVLSLPRSFLVRDMELILGVTKSRAQVIGNLMAKEGFVRYHFEKVPPRFRRKVFERL